MSKPITREEQFLAAMAGEGTAPKPLTRKEQFMAKSAGQTKTAPTPLTRKEGFMDKVSTGGGGDDPAFYMASGNMSTDPPALEVTQLPHNYVCDEFVDLSFSGVTVYDGTFAIVDEGGDGTIHLYGLILPNNTETVTAETSSGYELNIRLGDNEFLPDYKLVVFSYPVDPLPNDFYEKSSDVFTYTTITISCGNSTLSFNFGYQVETT